MIMGRHRASSRYRLLDDSSRNKYTDCHGDLRNDSRASEGYDANMHTISAIVLRGSWGADFRMLGIRFRMAVIRRQNSSWHDRSIHALEQRITGAILTWVFAWKAPNMRIGERRAHLFGL